MRKLLLVLCFLPLLGACKTETCVKSHYQPSFIPITTCIQGKCRTTITFQELYVCDKYQEEKK